MAITALFLHLGGVLLTNGWDRNARELAAKTFDLDHKEMDERTHLTFDTYEVLKLTLDEYLSRIVFFERRNFTEGEFRDFMFAQSKAFPEMIDLAPHPEGAIQIENCGGQQRRTRAQRAPHSGFQTRQLRRFFHLISCSSTFANLHADIYRIALDIAQVPPAQVAYMDDRNMFVQVAEGLGIHGIHHTSYASTCAQLAAIGLKLEERRNAIRPHNDRSKVRMRMRLAQPGLVQCVNLIGTLQSIVNFPSKDNRFPVALVLHAAR